MTLSAESAEGPPQSRLPNSSHAILLYFVAYLDPANVGFAKLRMAYDLGFSEEAFDFCIGIFFLGYLTVPPKYSERSVIIPWDSAPRYLLRDRDRIFGRGFVDQVRAMGIKQVLSAPRCPSQRAYVERVIGSTRRECLDHIIVVDERSLVRTITRYCSYYHCWRTHLSLDKDAPDRRRSQGQTECEVIECREVGGLHHHYERWAV